MAQPTAQNGVLVPNGRKEQNGASAQSLHLIQAQITLAGKVIAITCANRGIGLGIAECCLINGAERVYSLDIGEPDEDFHTLAKRFGGKLKYIVANVTKEETVNEALNRIVEETGALHGMVVNAGKTNHKAALDFTADEIQNLSAINLSSVPALRSKGIHVVQFSPLGNMNDFYRQTGWSKEISHMVRVIDQPILKELGIKYGKSPVQITLAWGVNNGRSVIPKSVVDWQIEENLAADFVLEQEDMEKIASLDAKARFNDPSLDYEWKFYSDLEGIDGTMQGRTH